MVKSIIFSALLFFSLSCSAVSPDGEMVNNIPNVKNNKVQSVTNSKPSEVKLTLSTEKKVWNKTEPLIVKFSFENLSEDSVKLSAGIGFLLTDITSDSKTRGIDFISPVSLTKVYDEKINGCQDDLTPDRFNETGGIISSKQTLNLEKGEKKEFSFDLNKICWNEMRSSVYANQNLSSLVKPGKYALYFRTAFDTGKIIDTPDNYNASTIRSTETNKIEIEIK
jgi:hypothetical protein